MRKLTQIKRAAFFTLLEAALVLLFVLSGCGENTGNGEAVLLPIQEYSLPASPETEIYMRTENSEPGKKPPLTVKNIDALTFYHSIDNPRLYEIPGLIRAGVVPHHTTAAPMISGFFSRAAAYAGQYDTVFILAPNHLGDLGDIIIADRDWDNGVSCDVQFTEMLLAAEEFNIILNNQRVEDDHSASIMIPYANHYIPDTKVVTVLINRSLGFDGSRDFAGLITRLARELGREVLWICSIDFSHFLTPREAMAHNRISEEAILQKDYWRIHNFDNHYMDSPNTMNIFLHILNTHGLEPHIIDQAEASEFLGYAADEVTSYMVINGG